ncbi:hypothetical protein SteCoe_24094 [Stentor coeruleus]|uniref:Uncharacterized protein n=1 Tax=Stentor coeruleus TaxID=5963 RepID=A0A1R2BID8_9CILI|nr:hypothetical protein SteCoe_24094 [Stentor coeruleus]
MARIAKTEVEISVGDLGGSPKTKACFNIGTGNAYISEHKEKLQNIIGQDPEELKFYMTIPCPSAEESQKFASFLTKTFEEAKSNPESMIGMGLRKLQMGGDDEGDEEPGNDDEDTPKAFDFKITTHLNNVIITIDPCVFKDAIKGTLYFITMQAGEVINFNSDLLIEMDTRRSIYEILSPDFINMISESAFIKVALSYDIRALISARSIGQNYSMDKKILRALGYASLYTGGLIKINFKSAENLDESIKGLLEQVVSMVSSVGQMIPPDVSQLVCRLAENSGHEVFIRFLTPIFAGEIALMMKDASQIFQSN